MIYSTTNGIISKILPYISQYFQRVQYIGGNRSFKLHFFFGIRVDKNSPVRMERLPAHQAFKPAAEGRKIIQCVADKRVAGRLAMDAYLMRPAGF